MVIEPFESSRLESVVNLSLRAWEPVFASIEGEMEPAVFRHFYPDWRTTQAEAVAAACTDDETYVWVASVESRTAGFVALRIDADEGLGEIYMIAVDPEFQRRGIARALTEHSLDWFEAHGMSVVMVETGGDPGHAPARAAYESLGFRPFPAVRYFRKV